MLTKTSDGTLEMKVLVNGRDIPEYGKLITCVEGRRGSIFSVLLTNNTGRRTMAVLSVEGLSVIRGKKARVFGTGYVINAHSSLIVPGWLLRYDKPSSFRFGVLPSDLASLMEKPKKFGTIQVTYFFEKPKEKTEKQLRRMMEKIEFGGPKLANVNMNAVSQSEDQSTRKQPDIHNVSLVWEHDYAAMLRIFYADAETLWKRYHIQVGQSHEVPAPIIDSINEEESI